MAKKIEIVDIDLSPVKKEVNQAEDAVENLKKALKATDDATVDLGSTMKKFGNEVEDMTSDVTSSADKIDNLVTGFSGLADAAAGVMGGIQAVEGAMQLMGVESEEVTKAIQKMQAMMAITDGLRAISQGVKGLYEMVKAVKAVNIVQKAGLAIKKTDIVLTKALSKAWNGVALSTKAASIATKGFKAALVSTGVGALIVLLGEGLSKLMSLWDEWTAKAKSSKALEEITSRTPDEVLQGLSGHASIGSAGFHGVVAKSPDSSVAKRTRLGNIADQIPQWNYQFEDLKRQLDEGLISVKQYKQKVYILANEIQDELDDILPTLDTLFSGKYSESELKEAREKQEAHFKAHPEALAGVDWKENLSILQDYYEKANEYINQVRGRLETLDLDLKQIADNAKYEAIKKAKELKAQIKAISEENKKSTDILEADESPLKASKRALDEQLADQMKVFDEALKAGVLTTDQYNEYRLEAEKRFNLEKSKITEDAEKEVTAKLAEYADESKEAKIKALEAQKREEYEIVQGFYEDGLISEQEYADAKRAIWKKLSKSIMQINKEFAEGEDGIIYKKGLELADIQMNREYKAGTAEGKGDYIGAAEIRLEYLEKERIKIEEIIEAYKELRIKVPEEVNQMLFGNKAETEQTEREKFDAQLEAANVSMDTTMNYLSQLTALGDGTNQVWLNVFATMQDGMNKVALSVKKGEKGWKHYSAIASSGLDTVSSLLGAIAGQQDTDTREGFETNKKLQIGVATMSMLSGIMQAWSTAMELGPILGPIYGAINSAMIAGIGAVQIAGIKKMTFDSSSSGSAAANPSLSALSQIGKSVSATTDVKGASEEGQVEDTRVYVLESDITKTQKKVDVTENEATF